MPIMAIMPKARPRFEALISLLFFSFMVLTAFASIMITVGTIWGKESLANWGALFSVPALVVAAFFLGCPILLLSIWTFRGAGRSLKLVAPYKAPIIIDPLPPQASQHTQYEGRPLFDEEVLELFRESADDATSPSTQISNAVNPDRVPISVPRHPSSLVVTKIGEKAFQIEVPTDPRALIAHSDFEVACVNILRNPAKVDLLVLESKSVIELAFETFCDFVSRLVEMTDKVAWERIRIAYSNEEFIGRLWNFAFKKYRQQYDIDRTLDLCSALVRACGSAALV